MNSSVGSAALTGALCIVLGAPLTAPARDATPENRRQRPGYTDRCLDVLVVPNGIRLTCEALPAGNR